MRPRPRFVLPLICLALGSPASAAEEPSGAVDVRDAIEATLAALGGRAAIAELRSLAVEADCTGPDGAFRTRVDSFLPGYTYFEQEADEGTLRAWASPRRIWQATPDGSFQDLDPGFRHFLRGHEFHLQLLEVESRFSGHRVVDPAAEVGGEPCTEIAMEDEAGLPATLCVSHASGLPLRLETHPEGAAGPVAVVYRDWRPVDGVNYFFGFDLSEGAERHFTYDYTRVEPNAVSADLFVSPAPAAQRDDQEALLEILRRDRRAHLETDAGLVGAHLDDTLFEVSGGRVNPQTREAVEAFFASMFEGAEYRMWEDALPPEIRISADGTMAWVVRVVRVDRRGPGPDGRPQTQVFTSAYTATYEKLDGAWRMTSVTSTFRGE